LLLNNRSVNRPQVRPLSSAPTKQGSSFYDSPHSNEQGRAANMARGLLVQQKLPFRGAGVGLLPAQITNLKDRCTTMQPALSRFIHCPSWLLQFSQVHRTEKAILPQSNVGKAKAAIRENVNRRCVMIAQITTGRLLNIDLPSLQNV
jgi:hypothetical protein